MTIFVHLYPFSACSWSIKTSMETQTNSSSSQDKLLVDFFLDHLIQILRLKKVVSGLFEVTDLIMHSPQKHIQSID